MDTSSLFSKLECWNS